MNHLFKTIAWFVRACELVLDSLAVQYRRCRRRGEESLTTRREIYASTRCHAPNVRPTAPFLLPV